MEVIQTIWAFFNRENGFQIYWLAFFMVILPVGCWIWERLCGLFRPSEDTAIKLKPDEPPPSGQLMMQDLIDKGYLTVEDLDADDRAAVLTILQQQKDEKLRADLAASMQKMKEQQEKRN